MARAIVNKLLHEPTAQLRAVGPEKRGSNRLAGAAAELFGLIEEPRSALGRSPTGHRPPPWPTEASDEPCVRIATRQSPLALWQARHVAALLKAHHAGLEVSLVEMTTEGDRFLAAPLSQVGGKGLFVKEIEQSLLDGRADIAVHSLKDMTSVLPEGLMLAAVPVREDPRDALLQSYGHHAGHAAPGREGGDVLAAPQLHPALAAAGPGDRQPARQRADAAAEDKGPGAGGRDAGERGPQAPGPGEGDHRGGAHRGEPAGGGAGRAGDPVPHE